MTLFILVLDPLQFIIKTYNNMITLWNELLSRNDIDSEQI